MLVEPGLVIHRAMRAEALVAPLASVLHHPDGDPFVSAVVAVPTRGVERWLAQRLSHHLGAAPGEEGVCAGVSFASPGRLVGAVLAGALAHLGEVDPDDDPWAAERLTWPVLELIDAHLDEPWCAALAHHLRAGEAEVPDGAPGGGRRLAVARRIAARFASYAAQRPEMVADWAAGGARDVPDDLLWQVELWRRVRHRLAVPSPAERLDGVLRLLGEGPGVPGTESLPDQLSVYGPTRLPETQLRVLAALAGHRAVHLWLVHPSPALWERVRGLEVVSPRRRESPPAARNRLLASMARDAVELQRRLAALGPVRDLSHDPAPGGPAETGRVAGPVTLLAELQRRLADDDPTPAGADMAAAQAIPDGANPAVSGPAVPDRSVQVHACHGRSRQVEVLREVVIGLLAADETLQPRDILVMCPDVEAVAPLVTAVFGDLSIGAGGLDGEAHPGHQVRLRLADRALRQTNPQLALLATLLDLASARVTAAQVLDLAASDAVRSRFSFSDDDLQRLREWVVDTGVRWGENAERRARFGIGGVRQGTWAFALDRLLLGVAVADEHEQRFLGSALAVDDLPSTDITLAGRLAELVERVERVLADLSGSHPVDQWVTRLTRALDLLADDVPGQTWQGVEARALLADVARTAAGHTSVPVTLADVRALLAGRLAGRPTRAGFRTGALTVCSLEPMRAVPHRVVCLLGMDDGAFPRSPAADGDDVLLRDARLGERDPRSEDRQLFLDAVAAARQHLVVLYSGADERTGAPRPPAVPVGELLDALGAGAPGPARDAVVVHHPLQPFDERCFTDGALGVPGPFAHDVPAFRAARARREAAGGPGPRSMASGGLRGVPLPVRPREATDFEVDLDDLIALLEHPAKWFLRRRLGVWLPTDEDQLSDRLPLEREPLVEWGVGERMLRACLDGATREVARAAENRRGVLPPRRIGQAVLDGVETAMRPVAAAARAVQVLTDPPRDLAVRVDLPGEVRLSGTVPGVRPGRAPGEPWILLRATYSRLAPKHRLRAWVQLLALAAGAPGEHPWRAVTIGRARGGGPRAQVSELEAPSVPAAVQRLTDLVRLAEHGGRAPLPMTADLAARYALDRLGGTDTVVATDDARHQWRRDWEKGFGTDAFLEACFGSGGDAPLFDPPTAAEQVWAPQEPTRLGVHAMRVWVPLLEAERMSAR